MVVRSQWEARTIYRDRSIFLEKGYMPAHQINVQVLGDQFGRLAVFGEREGSLLYGNQKLFEESPSPALDKAQRAELLAAAGELARLFHLQNAASIEFLMDENGVFYFVEIKPRIQMEHPLTEMTARIDLVKEQIRLAAGDTLNEDLGYGKQHGCAIQCRIAAENPWRNFLPSPGEIESVRLPSGQDVRVDTYIQAGSEVPADYDPLIAKLVVWGPTREACLRRARLAVDEFKISGTPTNLPVIQNVLQERHILDGRYNTDFRIRALAKGNGHDLPCETPTGQADGRGQTHMRDLAIAAAIYYVRRSQAASPSVPDRLRTGWHLKSRQLP
jgi:acetyl/propionyl-CoA carboxylase alpha subunit